MKLHKDVKDKRTIKRFETLESDFRKAHGYKYDYSLVEFMKVSDKVKIICPEHGIFEQYYYHHLTGSGCMKCSGRCIPSTKEWIEKAKVVHGDKYDYSLVEYIKATQKVKIICKEHGVFEQTPNSHLSGSGCMKCHRPDRSNFSIIVKNVRDKIKESNKITTSNTKEEIISKLKIRQYINDKSELNIIKSIFDPYNIIIKFSRLRYCILNNLEIRAEYNNEDYRIQHFKENFENKSIEFIKNFLTENGVTRLNNKEVKAFCIAHCIKLNNYTTKEFYDFLNGSEKCIYCDRESKFISFHHGYYKTCDDEICTEKHIHKNKSDGCKRRERRFKNTIMDDGRTFKEHMSDKSRTKMSKLLKQKIKDGVWTPCVTNSRAKSRIYINEIPLRSSWEAYFYLLNPSLHYEKTRIKYKINDKERIYITDFTDEVNKIIYEIKPNSERMDNTVIAKETYAKQWCQENGYIYKFISDDWFKNNYDEKIVLNSNIINIEYKNKLIKNLKQFK